MLNKKEIRIVQLLIEDKGKYVTSHELAKQLSCSDRTIRTYYKSLVEKLADNSGIEIISKQGRGYKLLVSDEEAYDYFLKENKINDNRLEYNKSADIDDRYNYLLNKLLFEQNEIYFDGLAEELFVSRSTLSSDFRKIRQKFAPYNLKIESKANKGVYVTGSERDKRRFIMDHFIDSGFINTMHSYVDNELLNLNISFEALTIIVLDECREGNLKLSDFVLQNLVVHIALAIRRVTEGFQITKLTEEIDLKDLAEREVARKILDRVTMTTGVKFPIEEADYITLHLISKSYGNAEHVSDNLLAVMRQELIQSIKLFSPEFANDFQLIEGLIAHLSTMLIRLESKVLLENPMTSEILENYKDMYLLSEKVMSSMPIFSHFYLSSDEIAYIALHFMAVSERHKEQNKYNILVICATGYGSAQMLKSRIQNELGSLVHIADVIGYYEINDDKLKNIDFIVSSIDLSNLIFSIPVFTVSVFLSEDELNGIKQGISSLRKSASQSESYELPPESGNHFDEYFSEKSFFVLKDTNKKETISQLLHSISDGEDEFFEKKMKEFIQQRETMSSVAFSDTIVVPHPIKALGKKHHIAVAVVPDGLYWEEDFPSVKFVFLTSMSIHENEGLPNLASYIVDLIDNPDIQEEMLASQSFKQFKELFLKIKER